MRKDHALPPELQPGDLTDEGIAARVASTMQDLNALLKLATQRGMTAQLHFDEMIMDPTGVQFHPLNIELWKRMTT